MDYKKTQLVTRYIKHLAESANIKVCTFNNLCNGLTGNRFEMLNVSYTHPLAARQEKAPIETSQKNCNFVKKIE